MKKTSKSTERRVRSSRSVVAGPARGPKPSFSREQIALAAVGIADAEGIEAVSMRRIAAKIGSSAASLSLHHEQNELLDLMMDTVLPEVTLVEASGKLRTDLRAIASQGDVDFAPPLDRRCFHFPILPRPEYSSLAGGDSWPAGQSRLDNDEMTVISNTIFNHARGYAAREIAEAQASPRSGLTREQWLISRAHHTRAILSTGNYPMFARVVMDARGPHEPHAAERGFYLRIRPSARWGSRCGFQLATQEQSSVLPKKNLRRANKV